MALANAADLVAATPDHPGQRAVDVSIARMRSPEQPMPPEPDTPANEAEIAVLESWLATGMPTACESGTGGFGGATENPYDTPAVCTSKTTWRNGNEESSKMRPGGACISCHSRGDGEEEEEGPRFAVAGTVYPTAHEPDDCNGINGPDDDTRVVIEDKNGDTFTLKVNSVGNFFLEEPDRLAMPYRAKVIAGGRARAMATAQSNGDCNFCHTEVGDKNAPGRIMAP